MSPRDVEAAPGGARPPGKRARNARRNRGVILDAARSAFAELGYGATTIRDIVRRTDLAAGTFYNYFPDKEAVLREILGDFTANLRERVHASRMGAHSLEELLRASFGTCFRLYAEETTLVAMITRNAGELDMLTSATFLEPATAELMADLRTKEAEGVVPPLDRERLARAAVALASELGLLMLSRSPIDIDGTTDFAVRFMLGGIREVTGRDHPVPAT